MNNLIDMSNEDNTKLCQSDRVWCTIEQTQSHANRPEYVNNFTNRTNANNTKSHQHGTF